MCNDDDGGDDDDGDDDEPVLKNHCAGENTLFRIVNL
jgi:hypothetical protein